MTRKWVGQVLVLGVGLGLVFVGLQRLGQATRDGVRHLDRYTAEFADLDCTPPPGGSRDDFLAEVQYLAGLPDRLRLLNDDLAPRLAEAFARHPWVEQVERVSVVPPGRVQVRLVYRRPVLAVRWQGRLWAVDRHGVLLPATADTEGLPVFAGDAAAPAGPAGTPWGDAAVAAAARTAAQRRAD
jgi:hypothetical protein